MLYVTACIAKIADVVFVVDASGSIGRDNFDKVKQFIKEVIMTFDVDARYTRVALIEYSSLANIEFKLNDKTNMTDLLDAVDHVNYSGGGTSTSDALELMRVEGFERFEKLVFIDFNHSLNNALRRVTIISKHNTNHKFSTHNTFGSTESNTIHASALSLLVYTKVYFIENTLHFILNVIVQKHVLFYESINICSLYN